MKKKIIILSVMFFVIACLVWAVYCVPLIALRFEAVDVEVLRLDSPDGKVDAVYIQRDAGAMTSADHLVYIIPDGQKPTEKDRAVFGGNRVFNLEIKWVSDCKLIIQYSKATIYHFQNYAYPFSENTEYRVEICEERVSEVD